MKRILFSLFLGLSLSSTAFADPEVLRSALRKIIPQENKDQLDRLVAAETTAERDQILRTFRAGNLRDFLNELDGRLNITREALLYEERNFAKGKTTSESHEAINQYRAKIRRDKLTPAELFELIRYYKGISIKNVVVGRMNPYRFDTEVVRRAFEVTSFPGIEIRVHLEERREERREWALPPIRYDAETQREWVEIFRVAQSLGLNSEFMQIWAILVNQDSGNRRYRHLETFEERFLIELCRRSLQPQTNAALFEGRDLLLLYLSNFNSNKFIERMVRVHGEDAADWPETADVRKSLGYFIFKLFKMRNAAQLRRLFSGDFPDEFSETTSRQLRRVMQIFQITALQVPAVPTAAWTYQMRLNCLTALTTAGKYEHRKKKLKAKE